MDPQYTLDDMLRLGAENSRLKARIAALEQVVSVPPGFSVAQPTFLVVDKDGRSISAHFESYYQAHAHHLIYPEKTRVAKLVEVASEEAR